MSLVQELIKSILVEGPTALAEAQGKEITPLLFSGPDQAALQFVYDYWREYGKIVPRELLELRSGINFADPPLACAQYAIDTIQKGRLYDTLQNGVDRIGSAATANDTEGALQAMRETLNAARDLKKDRIKPVPITRNFRAVLAHHDRIAAGHRGILTPWETINEGTYGFGASDFVLFVARLGIGKTWQLIILLLFAWQSKKRVLIATTEMDQLRMSLRVLALHLHIPPDFLRKGQLGASREAVVKIIEDLENQTGMWMVGGGNYRLGFDAIEAAAEEVEPELILLDGAYLLDMPAVKGKPGKRDGRFDKAAETFEECKQFNLRMKTPVVATTQFNRSARRNSLASAEVENIALSDTAGWAADYIFGLLQTDDMKEELEMIVKPLKTREGGVKEFMIRWDIDRADFQEIPHTRLTQGAGKMDLGGSSPFEGDSKKAKQPDYSERL